MLFSEWAACNSAPVSCGGCNRRKSAKRRPPPQHVQRAASTVAWYVSARLTKAGHPVAPRAGVVDIIPAPQCYTVMLACDPRDLPRVLAPAPPPATEPETPE